MPAVSVNHYENFPVASWLCPARIRPAVVAIYRFARTADDMVDEGDADAPTRLADLARFRAALELARRGDSAPAQWPEVFGPLKAAIAAFQLPLGLLSDLLSAFEQDVRKSAYADRVELLDYCTRSANPVGRLMMHLYGIRDSEALQQSDAICTALQLANFWQDLGVDLQRGRRYVPQADCNRLGLAPPADWALADVAGTRALVMELTAWTRSIMQRGEPLVHRIRGSAGLELRLVVQGGLRILDKIEKLDGATIARRPTLSAADVPVMTWRALTMRPAWQSMVRES